MHTFLFLFDSYGFLTWLFAFGCVLLGLVYSHNRWSASIAQILRLRREQARLQQELALHRKSVEERAPDWQEESRGEGVSSASATRSSPRPMRSSPQTARSGSRPGKSGAAAARPTARVAAVNDPLSQRSSLREDRQLGLVFFLAPDDPDPLERLSSITGEQVRELNLLGVYRFEQIARWTETNLEAFALLLGVESEELRSLGWVREARALHGELHGSKMELAS